MTPLEQAYCHFGCSIRHLWKAVCALWQDWRVELVLLLTILAVCVCYVAGCSDNYPPVIRITSATPKQSAQAWVAQDTAHRWFTDVAGTGSMEPQIHGGDIACFEIGRKPVLGDVVSLYYSAYIPSLCHRIVFMSADGKRIKTRGDANPTSDEWRDASQINGILIKVISTK